MWISGTAVAVRRPWARTLLCALGLTATHAYAQAPAPLTLDAALQRVITAHPSLQALDLSRTAVEAEADLAAQRPALSVAADAENLAGTGARSGIEGAEWTLTLSGLLERGGKRALRQTLAARRVDALAPRRAAAALDLLADGALRYLDVVAADGAIHLATDERRERERWADLARARARAGAIPAAVPLMAEANAARARFELQQALMQRQTAWRRLAALWGDYDAPVSETLVPADPLQLPAAPELAQLQSLLQRNPELEVFNAEARLRESHLRLAEASRAPDVTWRAGLRRLEDADDWALVAGASVTLDARARAEPGIRAARAELEGLTFEHQADERRLLGLLVEAHGTYVALHAEVARVRDELLPAYDAATAAAEQAWRAGALSPLEWSELQNERLAARRAQLTAALNARRALIEIQRLTAEPLRP